MNPTSAKWWESDPYADKLAVGVVMHKIDGQWVVARSLMGSPADKAGLVKGDALLAVGGNSLFTGIGEAVIDNTLSLLDARDEVEVAVLRAQKMHSLRMPFKPLSELLEQDEQLGGAALGYCKSCRSCRSRVTGVSDCRLEGGSCSIPCSIG